VSGAGAPEFRVTGTERPFEGSLIQVRVDHIVGPDGREDRREMVEHPGAVAALVVDLEGRVLLVEQWRHATGRRVVEVCAGKYDVAGEAITDALRRELAEELRVEGGRLTWLATFYTTPGWSDEVVDLYLAEDVRPIQGEAPAGDWEEAGMKVVALDYDQAVELATRSSPGDSKTLVALGLYGLMRAGRWKPDPAGAPPPDAPARRAARRAARG
jgi:ADP-ribose pyrophosphatase